MTRRTSNNFHYRDDFERGIDRLTGAIVFIWALGAIVSLATFGVVIWAVIALVNHFT